MSDAGKSQEPSMEEILASIRRIIAEDEAGRARGAPLPAAPRSTDGPSRAPRMPNGMPQAQAPRAPQPADSGDMVLDLTNMVAADGSVVTIAPPMAQGRPAHPQGFATPPAEQQPAAYSGFSRRAPPPGPGAEPRTPSYTPPPIPPAPQQPMGFAPSPDAPSRIPAAPPPAPEPARPMPTPMPLPPNLSEDSPSRRVFKRRHTAGSAFAELAQTGFAPPPAANPPSGPAHPDSGFGQVPMGSVATELDMSQPAAQTGPAASTGFVPDPHVPPAAQPDQGFAAPSFAPAPDAYAAPPSFAPPPPQPMMAPPPVAPPPPPAAISDDHVRAIVSAAAEPAIRSWLDANLQGLIERQLAALVQQQVEQSLAAALPQAVDQRIHQNVEANLSPYIEDRVGAHVDARLATAVEEKVAAAVKQQVAAEVNKQIAQAVTQHVASAVTQQLQGQQQNVSRLVDDRVKSEIRTLFSRLAGN